jgi:hypothetical protein
MCSATIPPVLTGIDGPLQLVQRGTHRPQASEDVNMHGRVERSEWRLGYC